MAFVIFPFPICSATFFVTTDNLHTEIPLTSYAPYSLKSLSIFSIVLKILPANIRIWIILDPVSSNDFIYLIMCFFTCNYLVLHVKCFGWYVIRSLANTVFFKGY